jgi:hypothetical protein
LTADPACRRPSSPFGASTVRRRHRLLRWLRLARLCVGIWRHWLLRWLHSPHHLLHLGIQQVGIQHGKNTNPKYIVAVCVVELKLPYPC